MVEAMKIMVTSLKRSHACTARGLCPQPCSRPPLTHPFAGDSRTPTGKSLVGSLLLSPGSWCTRFCCVLQESISQSCVSSGSSIAGLLATLSKRTYVTPTPRALSLQQTTADVCLHRRRSNTVLSRSLWGPWVLVHTRFVWALWASLAGTWFDAKREFIPPTILLRLLLCPWTRGVSLQPLQCLLGFFWLWTWGSGTCYVPAVYFWHEWVKLGHGSVFILQDEVTCPDLKTEQKTADLNLGLDSRLLMATSESCVSVMWVTTQSC